MTSVGRHVTRCPIRLQANYPHVPCPLLSAQGSNFLSCLHETRTRAFRVQRCHRFHVRKASWSTRHRVAATATAMAPSTPGRIEIIEGSQLQERPDSTHEMFLYTHMLCPYAQTALLTLLHLVRKVDFLPPHLSDMPKLCRPDGQPLCRVCRIKWYILTYQKSQHGSHSSARTRALLPLFLSSTAMAKLKLRVLTSAGSSSATQ